MRCRVAAIVNPRAAGGRTGELWPELGKLLRARLGEITVGLTTSSGDATEIAREFISNGHDFIIAVGGDGTVNEVVNGLLRDDRLINPQARLGILPLGTGADFPRSLAISPNPDQAIDVLAGANSTLIDVGKIKYISTDGTARSRYFVNLTSFGVSGTVAVRAKRGLDVLGGKAAFFWATISAVLTDRGHRVEIMVDGHEWKPIFITNMAVGNGRFHGGGMHACPRAVLDDGLLDGTIIEYLNPFEVLRDIRVLYSGQVYTHPKIHHVRAQRIAARSSEPTWIEVDGEALGCLPIEIELLPRQLAIMTPGTPRESEVRR